MTGITQLGALPPPAYRPESIASAPSAFLPKEHGSWSLALEPLALGLLVAPSSAGAALVTAAVIGFFARRPLKAALAANSARRQSARTTLVLLSVLALLGLSESLMLGSLPAHWPLLIAAPFGGLFLYFDRQNESRAAAAELAGSATFALLPATFATLAGWSWPAALALSVVALARSLPTVLAVRTYLRLARQQPANPLVPLAAGALALLSIGYLAALRLVPMLAAGLVALLMLRTVFLVTSLRPGWPARRVGLLEAVLGALYVGSIALAYHGQ